MRLLGLLYRCEELDPNDDMKRVFRGLFGYSTSTVGGFMHIDRYSICMYVVNTVADQKLMMALSREHAR